ncbi:MAG: CHAT domain-containing protein [Gammaproteobacteria bacterium]
MSRRIISTHGLRYSAMLWLALLVQVACVPLANQPAQHSAVPSVIGSQINDAREQIVAQGFAVEVEDVFGAALKVRFGDDRDAWPDPNTVIAQDPKDTILAPGATVRLLVARHSPPTAAVEVPINVPQITGLSLDAGARALQEAGIRVRTTYLQAVELAARFGTESGRWPASNTIVDQAPVGGNTLATNAAVVDVAVAQWSLADVSLGAMIGIPATDLKRKLEAAGYRVEVQPRAPGNARNARRGEVLAARLGGQNNGQNVMLVEVSNANGANVTRTPVDADSDGVPDAQDRCPGSSPGANVDARGCAQLAPVDTDGDGVIDANDDCPATLPQVAVDARGCARVVVTGDADGDGVPDDQDLCPNSPAGSLGAPQGCTLTQRVNRLPEGLYAFNRQTSMEVGRPEGYKIVLVLDPRSSAAPSDIEARVLSELPGADRPPARDIELLSDNLDECAPPVICFREKYYEKMRVDLRVDQDGWVIRPDNPVAIRGVVSDEVTRWGWTVTPACDGGGLLSGECRPADLTLDAYAMFDDASYGPIMVFNEKITVEVAAQERVASFFERFRGLIFIGLLLAVLFGVATWWLSRRRPAPVATPEFEAVSVLFVGANPRGTSRIRLDEEVRGIDQSIRLGERRDAFTLHQHWAARLSDLDDALMRFRPNIVHISAHGTQNGELLLEGGDGDDGKVSAAQLEKLFAILSDDIRLVILNACFSEEQARLVVNHVDCVVGMSDAVNDKVAQRFAESFYLALANGRSVQIAFELASAESQGKAQDAVPRLLALRSDPNRVEFARRAPTRHIEGVKT